MMSDQTQWNVKLTKNFQGVQLMSKGTHGHPMFQRFWLVPWCKDAGHRVMGLERRLFGPLDLRTEHRVSPGFSSSLFEWSCYVMLKMLRIFSERHFAIVHLCPCFVHCLLLTWETLQHKRRSHSHLGEILGRQDQYCKSRHRKNSTWRRREREREDIWLVFRNDTCSISGA